MTPRSALLSLLAWVLPATAALAPTTAFSSQGRLAHAGAPAQGVYRLEPTPERAVRGADDDWNGDLSAAGPR